MNASDENKCLEILNSFMDAPFDGGLMGLVYGLCIAVEYQMQNNREEWEEKLNWAEIHRFVRDFCKNNEISDQFTHISEKV